MNPDQPSPSSDEYPQIVRSICMYCKNPAKNEDKEYHIQLLRESANTYNVHSQNGRRGTKLTQRVKFELPVGKSAANQAFNELEQEKKQKKGYKEINLAHLGQIYVQMVHHQMDSAGVDLYMNRRGKFISLAEYARQAGEAASGQDTQIRSYSNARAARETLQEMGVGNAIDSKNVIVGLSIVTRMLLETGLDAMDVFIGYRDSSNQIYRGVPAQYLSSKTLKP